MVAQAQSGMTKHLVRWLGGQLARCIAVAVSPVTVLAAAAVIPAAVTTTVIPVSVVVAEITTTSIATIIAGATTVVLKASLPRPRALTQATCMSATQQEQQ